MHPYTIVYGNPRHPRLVMPVYARSTFDAVLQHACLKQDGEKMDVFPGRCCDVCADLLEAARAFVSWAEGSGLQIVEGSPVAKARAAIARATGEQS